MNYRRWTIYADMSLAEWGDYVFCGTWTGTRVLWQGHSKHPDSNQVKLQIRIHRKPNMSASVSLQYFNHHEHLWSFPCRSLSEAVRKANFRLQGQTDSLVRRAVSAVYEPAHWRCAYKGDQPFCSFYYGSHEITNGEGLGCGEYTFVEPNGIPHRYNFHYWGYSGGNIAPDPRFKWWIGDQKQSA